MVLGRLLLWVELIGLFQGVLYTEKWWAWEVTHSHLTLRNFLVHSLLHKSKKATITLILSLSIRLHSLSLRLHFYLTQVFKQTAPLNNWTVFLFISRYDTIGIYMCWIVKFKTLFRDHTHGANKKFLIVYMINNSKSG